MNNIKNINNIDKLTLEYLINPEQYKKYYNKNNNIDNEFDNDKIFYRKRIINLIKEMFKGNFDNKSLEDNFNDYIKNIIIHLKRIDTKDILQQYYIDISNNDPKKNLIDIDRIKNLNDNLFYNEKPKINTIENFVKHKKEKKEIYILPKKKEINLKDPKLKKKGLPQKEKYTNIINEQTE